MSSSRQGARRSRTSAPHRALFHDAPDVPTVQLAVPADGRASGAALSHPEAAQRLRQRLMAHIGPSLAPAPQLELALTDNQCTMITVRREPGRYRLRLHHMFAEAGPDIVAALGRYVTRAERDASALLGEFISANQARIVLSSPRRSSSAAARARSSERPRSTPQITPHGRHHDLQNLLEQLNRDYFDGTINAAITWAQSKRPGLAARRHKSLQLGSYTVEDALIRIHPTLDRPQVPGYFVAWIIYHEMLHQKHGVPVIAGRRCFHSAAFVAEERLFDDYERAHLWERQNAHWLLWY